MDRREKPPRGSVIVPARNEEHNIAGCIGSLLEQDSGIEIAVEIILADDGSEDQAGWVPHLVRPGGRGHCKRPHVSPLFGNVGRLDEKLVSALPW